MTDGTKVLIDTRALEEFRETLIQAHLEVAKQIPGARFDKLARRWRCPRDLLPAHDESLDIYIILLGLAVSDAVLFDTGVSGKSAFDRFLRRSDLTVAVREAVCHLHTAYWIVGPVVEKDAQEAGHVVIHDRFGGQHIRVYAPRYIPLGLAEIAAVRVVDMPQTNAVVAAIPIMLIEGGLQEYLDALLAAGPAGTRLSEKVWQKISRRYIRARLPAILETRLGGYLDPTALNDLLADDGLNSNPARSGPVAVRPTQVHLDPHDPFDAQILSWLQHPPTQQAQDFMRFYASTNTVIQCLAHLFVAQTCQMRAVADACRDAAKILIDTLMSRAEVGLHDRAATKSQIRGAIRAGITARHLPGEALGLLDTLFGEVEAAQPRRRQSDNPEIARVLARIAALEVRTTDHGFCEEEAYAAAQKLAGLMDRYGQALQEADLVSHEMVAEVLDTGRKRSLPVHDTISSIGVFCDCKTWFQKTPDGIHEIVFFGLIQDSRAAASLYRFIERTFEEEMGHFQSTQEYQILDRGRKRRAAHAFDVGLARRIIHRLHEIKSVRQQSAVKTSGRDLIELKSARIDDELTRMGMDFRAQKASRYTSDNAAFEAGYAAGGSFEI